MKIFMFVKSRLPAQVGHLYAGHLRLLFYFSGFELTDRGRETCGRMLSTEFCILTNKIYLANTRKTNKANLSQSDYLDTA